MLSQQLEDPRVKRSQDRLKKAMIELVLEEGYSAITIQALTDRANVGYATFFRHYDGLDDLLADVLGELHRQLRALLPPHSSLSPAEEGQAIFEHAATNERLYRILLQDDGATWLLREIGRQAAEGTAQTLAAQYGDSRQVPVSIVSRHWVEAKLVLLRWWFDHDKPYSAARMGEIFAVLISGPSMSLLGEDLATT